jgi:hypothetical protein
MPIPEGTVLNLANTGELTEENPTEVNSPFSDRDAPPRVTHTVRSPWRTPPQCNRFIPTSLLASNRQRKQAADQGQIALPLCDGVAALVAIMAPKIEEHRAGDKVNIIKAIAAQAWYMPSISSTPAVD